MPTQHTGDPASPARRVLPNKAAHAAVANQQEPHDLRPRSCLCSATTPKNRSHAANAPEILLGDYPA
jgi:hypothetical protein